MVAGATGIDLVLLVIAADDGVMPQTREHLDIVSLLGVNKAVVAITKCDLVEDDWLPLVHDEVSEILGTTPFEKAPIINVSATAGHGIPELKNALLDGLATLPDRLAGTGFYLPIDRVFTLQGFGTVVTGTIRSGRVEVGDAISIEPQGLAARVRGVHVHDCAVGLAVAGQRAAVNLTGVERGQVERGSVAAENGLVTPTRRADARVALLSTASTPITHRDRVRVHIGTGEHLARVALLEGEQIAQGGSMLVQLHFEQKIAAQPSERFVLRRYSPATTLGGGHLIDTHPKRHKRGDSETLGRLNSRDDTNPNSVILAVLSDAGPVCLTPEALSRESGIPLNTVSDVLDRLVSEGTLWRSSSGAVAPTETRLQLGEQLANILTEAHEESPHLPGLSIASTRQDMSGPVDDQMFERVLDDLKESGVVEVEGGIIRMSGHAPRLTVELSAIENDAHSELETAGLTGLSALELAARVGSDPATVDDLLAVWMRQGFAHRIADNIWCLSAVLEGAEAAIREHIEEHGPIEIGECKTLWGLSRQPTLRILEYFDSQKLTIRIESARILARRRQALSIFSVRVP